jgi:putative transposase
MFFKGGDKIKKTRVEQQVIRKSHPMWKVIDENCFYSKTLYNHANYIIRQEFIENRLWIRCMELDKMLQNSEPYKQLKSQPSQCVLQVLDRNWKSFFKSMKDWKKNPSKYLGMPKLPDYKPKDGRFPWFIKNNCCSIQDGKLVFRVKRLQTGYQFKTKAKGRLICVRFIPHGSHYTMEVVTEIEIPDFPEIETKNIASIDLGVNNFVTLTNNIGLSPIIINGRGIKSINQFYNKQHSKTQSDLMLRNGTRKSNSLGILDLKRKNRVKNYIHHSSRFIVNYCKENEIDTLVCGLNQTWKQDFKSSKANKQNFIHIPYDMLIRQLEYKCEEIGIKFLTVDEAYTSGTSFLDGEFPCKENYNKKRRVKRGLFQANEKLINADVNGSLQIMTKVFPNAFSYGIEGNLTPTIINAARVA